MSEAERFLVDVARRHRRCVWLDGGGARAWSGAASYVGWLTDDDVSLTYAASAREVTRHRGGRSEVVGDDIFAVLEAELGAEVPGGAAATGPWFGYLGYAARPDLPARPDPHQPDAVWLRPSRVRRFEHAAGAPRSPTRSPARSPASPVTVAGGAVDPAYAAGFARVSEHLHAGNSYEVNLTHRLERAADPDPVATYLRLRASNPAPYAGFLQHDVDGARGWLLSSSPERFALIGADGRVETRPIKGTTPRGATSAADAALRERLASDHRFRAENLMIVDLLRHDLARVSEVGSVEVPSLMSVESYPGLHQLVSTVRSRLLPGVSTVAALRSLFPAGSMTGAPKLRTMQIVEEVETTPRGAYAGAFGWLGADGRADLGVVIRSLTTVGDGRWRLGTGGGITVYSDVETEWAETEVKAARVLAALGPR